MAKDNRRISEELMQGVLIDDPTFLKEIVERMLQELLEGEMTHHLGAGPYGERTSTGTGGDRFSEPTDPACQTEPSRGGGATPGGNGSNRRQVAEKLFISLRTVNSRMCSIRAKLGVGSRSAVTRYAIEHKLI